LKIGPSPVSPVVICIYTRKGEDWKDAPGGLHQMMITGFSRISKFQSASDQGVVLYWNPIENSNTFRIRFYNNAMTRIFRIVIEGMRHDGELVHFEKVICSSLDK
jgi:hypothetical protein